MIKRIHTLTKRLFLDFIVNVFLRRTFVRVKPSLNLRSSLFVFLRMTM